MANYPIIELSTESLSAFAYTGKKGGFIGMTEDQVKAAMKSALEARAYDVEVKWGQAPGVDIQATLGNSKTVIEAKGEGAYRQMLGNFYLQALGSILQRMDGGATSYGIALPAHRSYIELILKLPSRVRQALQLDCYFVRPTGTTAEIGVLRWTSS